MEETGPTDTESTESLQRWEWEGGAVDAEEAGEPESARVVVCGVDGSPDAAQAARLAVRLAAHADARLALVTVARFPVVHGAAAVPGARRELRASTLEASAALLEETARALEAGVPIDCHLELGDPARGLIAVAERTRAMAIVVGTRGLGALRSAMVGSVAAGVCRRAPCPVLVVPGGVTAGDFTGRERGRADGASIRRRRRVERPGR